MSAFADLLRAAVQKHRDGSMARPTRVDVTAQEPPSLLPRKPANPNLVEWDGEGAVRDDSIYGSFDDFARDRAKVNAAAALLDAAKGRTKRPEEYKSISVPPVSNETVKNLAAAHFKSEDDKALKARGVKRDNQVYIDIPVDDRFGPKAAYADLQEQLRRRREALVKAHDPSWIFYEKGGTL